MKTTLSIILSTFFIFTTAMADSVDNANQTLLPDDLYAIYTDGTTVINHPETGFTEKFLPTMNLYKGSPGCYIACYSHHRENAIYSVDSSIYVLGQVRIAGKYKNRICEPTNYTGKDISGDAIFKTICTEKIKSCEGNNCWAGGDTGGWFGIP